MMPIIIDNHDSFGVAFDLEPAMNARERVQSVRHVGKRNFQLLRNGNGRQSIGHAVPPRQMQPQFSQRLRAIERGKFYVCRVHLEILRRKISLR